MATVTVTAGAVASAAAESAPKLPEVQDQGQRRSSLLRFANGLREQLHEHSADSRVVGALHRIKKHAEARKRGTDKFGGRAAVRS